MNAKMTDVNSMTSLLETDAYAKKLKRSVDDWRELAIFAYSVLLWKKKAYPWAIFGSTTFLFLELGYYDPSFITIFSLIFLFVNLLDYFGPIIVSTIWKPDNWTSAKEREFEEICRSVASFIVQCKYTWNTIMDLKATKPNMYYPIAFVGSCLCAWLGNSVNNLFLTYLIVLMALMAPALLHHGLIQKYYQAALLYAANFLRGFSAPGSKTKIQ